MAVHPTAARGYSSSPDAFLKGRPDYPPEIADWLRDDLRLGPGKVALDLGAGTGKFLPLLESSGADVIAVEPLDALRAKLITGHPHVEAMAGNAEHIPLASASVHAMICAQSFHWFANRRALDEIHRVLKPEGVLGLVWNVRDENVPWVSEMSAIIERYSDDTPRYRDQNWRLLFPSAGFTSLVERQFSHQHTGSPEQVIVARTMSISFIAALPLARQDEIATEIRALIARTPELAGQSQVSFPYRTEAFCCRRLV